MRERCIGATATPIDCYANGITETYTYYADGTPRTKTAHTGAVTTYTYDGLGQLTKESESNGTTLAYTYDRNGNRTKLTATGSEHYTMVYTYDAANRSGKQFRVFQTEEWSRNE